MSKCFQPCPLEVFDRAAALVDRYHAELAKHGVTIELLFVHNPDKEDEPVLSCRGVPALAVARIVSVKDRAKGCKDAEICIDMRCYEESEPAQRDALLDHELQHFELKKKEEVVKRDTAGRPCLKLRKHDFDFGWFEAVALRHGRASPEVRQAKQLWGHQSFFSFLEGDR